MSELKVNTISEQTSANGVTIDSVPLKDGELGTTANPVAINSTSLNSGQFSGRNIIINGAMNVAQRGTSTASIGATTGYYTVDRIQSGCSGNSSGRYTMTQETITDLGGFSKAVKIACTTADTSIASSEWEYLAYNIEAQDLQRLKFGSSDAEKFTVSFYVKGNASATYTLGAYSVDSNRYMAKTFSVTTNFTRVSLTFEADTSGAINADNGVGMVLYFNLQAGTDRTSGTIPSTWETLATADIVDSSQTQFFDSTSRTLFITGLQMEVGEVATDFEFKSFAEEERLCQRYYVNTNHLYVGNWGQAYSSTQAKIHVKFPVTMRASPTMSYTSPFTNMIEENGIAVRAPNTVATNYISPVGNIMGVTLSGQSFSNSLSGVFIRTTTGGGKTIEANAEL